MHIHGLGIASDGTLYVATHGGLIKRTGTKWIYASSDRNDYMGFSMDPKSGLMWRSGHSPDRPSLGVENSTDSGRTWKHLSDALSPAVDFHAMAVSLADGKTLWGWDSGRRGLFRSSGGSSWEKLPQNPFTYVLSAPAKSGVVLAGIPDGMLRSTDGGMTWKPVAALAGGWVIAIAADPSDPTRLLASTQHGLKRSTDGGLSWEPALNGIPPTAEITSLAISPAASGIAYAAAATTIYTTTDAGKNWSVLRSGS